MILYHKDDDDTKMYFLSKLFKKIYTLSLRIILIEK